MAGNPEGKPLQFSDLLSWRSLSSPHLFQQKPATHILWCIIHRKKHRLLFHWHNKIVHNDLTIVHCADETFLSLLLWQATAPIWRFSHISRGYEMGKGEKDKYRGVHAVLPYSSEGRTIEAYYGSPLHSGMDPGVETRMFFGGIWFCNYLRDRSRKSWNWAGAGSSSAGWTYVSLKSSSCMLVFEEKVGCLAFFLCCWRNGHFSLEVFVLMSPTRCTHSDVDMFYFCRRLIDY